MQNPDASSTATLLPGTRLGRYEITSFVAAGGMGEVYRAKGARRVRYFIRKSLH